MDNQRIAEIFQEIGDILDINGENRFRVLAYQKASQNILNLPRELRDIFDEDPKKLEEIPGIGKDLAAKIAEMLTTGKCSYHQDLLKKFDKGLLEILRVRGVGPKKVKLFYSSLGIDSIEKLRKAAEAGKLRDLPKMGEKSEAEILIALKDYDKHTERMMLSDALHQARKLVKYMEKCPGVEQATYAGSLRRMKETIGDIDILVSTKNPGKYTPDIMKYFLKFPEMEKVLAQGETKSAMLLHSGVQTDLRVLDAKIFGAALHYFTGSKAHNIVVRDRAKKMGLKVSEYGVFKIKHVKGKKEPREILIGGATEEEVFKSVGLPFIQPEMREDRGEVEAALKGKLITPVERKDLKGDMHVHSKWSDGSQEIQEVARAYYEAGFEYFALTDHSPAVKVAHGLTPDRFKLQWSEIDAINKEYEDAFKKKKHVRELHGNRKDVKPFRILKGTECDILSDGSLDLPDKVLAKMDIVLVSVHSRFKMSEAEMTARVVKALKNPFVKIWGHPSGRLINEREPYAIDMEKAIHTAIEHHVALEIDGQPARLDLFDYYCKMAKDRGAKFTVDSDSHHTLQMEYLDYGIAVAKRGWLEKKDVLNTLPLEKLMKYWEKKI
jgi:DNA polymerase (family 10)